MASLFTTITGSTVSNAMYSSQTLSSFVDLNYSEVNDYGTNIFSHVMVTGVGGIEYNLLLDGNPSTSTSTGGILPIAGNYDDGFLSQYQSQDAKDFNTLTATGVDVGAVYVNGANLSSMFLAFVDDAPTETLSVQLRTIQGTDKNGDNLLLKLNK